MKDVYNGCIDVLINIFATFLLSHMFFKKNFTDYGK